MANTVNLTFAGDAKALERASKQADKAISGVGSSATAAADDMTAAARDADNYTDRVATIGTGVMGMTDAIDSAGAAVQGLADFQSAAADRAQRLARAANDVRQAQEDYNQALRDGAQAEIDSVQAGIDLEQARLDQKTALDDYNEAVKEHGRDSDEARQAQIDLKQAGVDVAQAQEDAAQATRDASQASIDATDATLNLRDAQKEANPPDLQKWADQIGMITPILSGLVGVVGLVTAAQWAWNAAQLASPTTWIVAGIIAVIAVIVLIATKTDWFQRAWRNSWKWIKNAASNTWDWLKKLPGWIATAFDKVTRPITEPFKAAFNYIARGWNSTIGSLHWTVPGWVPGIGGNTISVPNIPTFHQGGRIPGAPGQEVLVRALAGEEVSTRATAARAGGGVVRLGSDGSRLGDVLIELIGMAMNRRGGDPDALGIRIER